MKYNTKGKNQSQVDVAELLNNFFTEIGPNLSRNVENVETTYEEFLRTTDKEFVFEETTSAHIFPPKYKRAILKAIDIRAGDKFFKLSTNSVFRKFHLRGKKIGHKICPRISL